MTEPSTRPVVRLRPKAEARAIRHGFPWVYADELVTDRRTQAIAPGTIATLEDAERRPLATVTVNPKSKIIARVLDRDAAAEIDRSWIAARIARAAELRARLFDAPFYRLVHAEADGLPGVIIDRFGDVAVVQPNAAWSEAMIGDIAAVLNGMGIETVVKNGSGRARGLEGLAAEPCLRGAPRAGGAGARSVQPCRRLRAGGAGGRGGAGAGGRCLGRGAGACAAGRGGNGRRGPVRDPSG
jgi:23S rRNA (cytosine1962-C5)-methyltransferase